MNRTKAHQIAGAGTIACAVAAFFWWGVHFRVFGSDIDWFRRPHQLIMPLLLVLAAFGAGLALGGPRLGVRVSFWTALMLAAAALLGAIRSLA